MIDWPAGKAHRMWQQRWFGILLVAAALSSASLAMATDSLAREYSRRVWRTEDGLPQNRIQALAQTPDGYLWIGTSEGLARFDGVRFVSFYRSNTPSFQDDSILALLSARDGSLWIGTEGGGLLHYRNGTFRAFGVPEGLTNGFVRALYEDGHGSLWVGTDRGLFRLAGKRFERLDGTPEVPLATVVSIAADPIGNLWVATSSGLLTMEGEKLVPVRCSHGPLLSRHALFAAHDGVLYIATHSGAQRIRGGCMVPDTALPAFPLILVREDHERNLWLGTIAHGLIRSRAGVLARFEGLDILAGNTVTAFLEDQEYNLWIGGQDGLLRLSKTAVATIGARDGLADDNISTVYEDRSQNLWITTATGQLYRLNKGTSTPERVELPAPVTSVQVRNVFEDSRGAYWFGTQGSGVIRLWRGQVATYSKKDGLRGDIVRQIYEDHAGVIWLATSSGLSRREGDGFRSYYLEDGLTYPSVRCIASSHSGDLLVGTDGGLNIVHDGKILPNPVAGLGREKIWSIYEDRRGGLWLGTRGGGLLRIKFGKIARLSMRDGLPSNSIYQIVEEYPGKLWMSGPAGVFSARQDDLDDAADGKSSALHVVLYGASEGMETSQMSGGTQPAGCKASSGEIWFPSVRGVVRVNPARALPGRSAPVLIERVLADDQVVPLGSDVVTPHGHGTVQIDFTACNLAAPQRESFRYKLEGFDERWTSPGKSRSAYYTNLPPGRYRFRVEASDTGSPGNATEASFILISRAPFYQTVWFYTLCALALSVLVWFGLWLNARQARARYAVLLAERTRLAREMHDTVIQGCVGISTLLEAAVKCQRSNLEEAFNLLDNAREQVQSTLEEARQAVWNLRHDLGHESAISKLRGLAQKLGRENGLLIHTEVAGKRAPLDPQTDRTLLLVGREALRNAVAHAKASRIDIRVSFGASEVCLEVTDDGIGFNPVCCAGDDRHFGIVGMKERVAQAGGRLELTSQPGQGTKITARLPLRSSCTPLEGDV